MQALVARVDNLLGKPWEAVGAAICWATGWNNYKAAKALAIAAPVAYVSAYFALNADMLPVLLITVPILVICITSNILRVTVGLEKHARRNTGTLSSHHELAVIMRLLLMAMVAVFLPTADPAWCVGLYISSGALYVATQDRPGTPSLARRLARQLTIHRHQTTVPSPT